MASEKLVKSLEPENQKSHKTSKTLEDTAANTPKVNSSQYLVDKSFQGQNEQPKSASKSSYAPEKQQGLIMNFCTFLIFLKKSYFPPAGERARKFSWITFLNFTFYGTFIISPNCAHAYGILFGYFITTFANLWHKNKLNSINSKDTLNHEELLPASLYRLFQYEIKCKKNLQ